MRAFAVGLALLTDMKACPSGLRTCRRRRCPLYGPNSLTFDIEYHPSPSASAEEFAGPSIARIHTALAAMVDIAPETSHHKGTNASQGSRGEFAVLIATSVALTIACVYKGYWKAWNDRTTVLVWIHHLHFRLVATAERLSGGCIFQLRSTPRGLQIQAENSINQGN